MSQAILTELESSTYFVDPIKAICVGILSMGLLDCLNLGLRRHRHWCRYGRDWVRNPGKGHDSRYPHLKTEKPHVPVVYRELHDLLDWILGRQFALAWDLLGQDVDEMMDFYFRLLGGPPIE